MGARVLPKDRPGLLPILHLWPEKGRIINGDDSQGTLTLQPRPLDTEANHHKATCEIVTNIRRTWAAGDCGPAGRCTRCVRCTARDNVCNLMVNRFVPKAEAPDFSPRALGIDVVPF